MGSRQIYAWVTSFMDIKSNTESVNLLSVEDQFFLITFLSIILHLRPYVNPSCVKKVSLMMSKEIGFVP